MGAAHDLTKERAWIVQEPYSDDLPAGWRDLFSSMLDDMEKVVQENPGLTVTIQQVKEKYGTLRCYFVASDSVPGDPLSRAVDDAENRSAETCDRCGKPGSGRDFGGWYSTLCDEHAAERTAIRRKA